MVEERIQRQKFFNGVVRVKQAKLQDYIPFKGSDGETSSEIEKDEEGKEVNNQSIADDYSAINDEDLMNKDEIEKQFKKMKVNMNSSRNLRGFLQGMQFYLMVKGFKLNLYSPSRLIIKNKKMKPNFEFDMEGFNIFTNCINVYQNKSLQVKLSIFLKHVMMADISAQVKKRYLNPASPRNVFSGRNQNLSNISKNYLDDFDDKISAFDDGRSINRNTGLYSNKTKKMGNRNDIFDLRADDVMKQKSTNQVLSIGNILNEDPYSDGPN